MRSSFPPSLPLINSASLIDEFVPGQMITGTGADIIFKIPVMRQIMAWIGTMPAKRKNITKTFEKGNESYHILIVIIFYIWCMTIIHLD
jgi:hypothetical protein